MRRRFVSLVTTPMLLLWERAAARVAAPPVTLGTAELELVGDWRQSALPDVAAVIGRMRAACLSGVDLVSDRQPRKLRVDDRFGSYPSVWLHGDDPATAWITVIVNTRDWCSLAYQFGHELGHVLCNSWQPDAAPRDPCQWVEEALVEAFSLHGLRRMAEGWAVAPPFPDDAAYAGSIIDYRATVVSGHRAVAKKQGVGFDLSGWFEAYQMSLGQGGGLDTARAAVPAVLDLIEGDPSLMTDMGALNRWPERTALALPDYLGRWEESCAALKSPGRLPGEIRKLLGAA